MEESRQALDQRLARWEHLSYTMYRMSKQARGDRLTSTARFTSGVPDQTGTAPLVSEEDENLVASLSGRTASNVALLPLRSPTTRRARRGHS